VADLLVPPAVLDESDDAGLAWAVIEPAYHVVDIYDGPEALARTIAPLTAGQRALLAVHWCIAEVTNGGFLQFFENPTGVLVAEAQEGFRRIGVPEAEMALRSAIEIVAKAPPGVQPEDPHYDEFEAREALDALQAKLEPLETRFFRLVDEEIYSAAATYVRGHRDEFVR
jgi:hypothetical protein